MPAQPRSRAGRPRVAPVARHSAGLVELKTGGLGGAGGTVTGGAGGTGFGGSGWRVPSGGASGSGTGGDRAAVGRHRTAAPPPAAGSRAGRPLAGWALRDWPPEGQVAKPGQVARTQERQAAPPTAPPPTAEPAFGPSAIRLSSSACAVMTAPPIPGRAVRLSTVRRSVPPAGCACAGVRAERRDKLASSRAAVPDWLRLPTSRTPRPAPVWVWEAKMVVCTACGGQSCGLGENRCNCPQVARSHRRRVPQVSQAGLQSREDCRAENAIGTIDQTSPNLRSRAKIC